MEWDGKVSASSYRCATAGRDLTPGEGFISALTLIGGEFRRLDFSLESWSGIDSAAYLSWWRRQVPKPEAAARVLRLDADLLQRLFTDLRESRERPQQCLCYVIVLCLVRARACILAGIQDDPDGSSWLLVDHKADGLRLRVRDPRMTPAELDQVQEALVKIVS